MGSSNGALSRQPLFEAFRIGAWWYTQLLKKKGNNYLVYFEGYGKYEEQELTSKCIRLRSRKAQSSDCCRLTIGADVVVFVVHPHSFRAGSNRSCYSAWYDVKITSKVYKHLFYTCACTYTVQFYSDWSRDTEIKSNRALLEGAVVDVSIRDIAIMQAALDSPLELLFEKSLMPSQESVERRWSKDSYTLNLSCSSLQPLYSTSGNQDARKNLAAVEHDICPADITANLQTDVSLEDVIELHMLQINTIDHLKDVGTVNGLSDQRKPVNSAKLMDLTVSGDLSVHADTGFIQETCSNQAVCETGRKRTRKDLPCMAKIPDTGVHAERGRKTKKARHTVASSELSSPSSDESSSSYNLSNSGSDSEESYDSEHIPYGKDETTDHSQSRSTPVFYGDGDEDHSIGRSLEFCGRNQDEDHGKSTSTRTFYGNTAEKSALSSSTAIFYGSSANEVDSSSIAEGTTNLTKDSKTDVEEQDHNCLPAKLLHTEEVDSISTSSKKRNPAHWHEFDVRSECFCNAMQISSDRSHSVCRACKSLQVEDSLLTASSHEESLKKTQVVASNSNTHHNLQDVPECCSESESVQQFKVLKKGKKNSVDYKKKYKSAPHVTKKGKNNPDGVRLQPRSCSTRKRDRDRSSKREEGKRNFNDLFDAILKSVHELTRAKMSVPSELPFSSTEEMQNQVPWDPIVFHKSTGGCKNNFIEDDPLKDLWKDMELAFEEMRGVAALGEQHIQPSQGEASACEHDLVVNEQEGYVCSLCGLVVISIEDILPPVSQEEVNHRDYDHNRDAGKEAASAACTYSTELQNKPTGPFETDMRSVWKFVQELRPLMKTNQVDGFNFLWKNIGTLSSQTYNEGGGCIVAHAPGTGKSLLIISFLKSFLHLHTWCRPLIVAPKNMLLSWKKEFEKWTAGIKVYLLQASSPLNCLNVISEWQKNTSIMIVNYQLFSQRVDVEKACRAPEIRQIGTLLLHIPDILVLDEGHVPRNCSKLRESLLQIRTRYKILVSGTLFQNNMQELFNLLYLARPNVLSYLQTQRPNERFDGIDLDNDNNKRQWQTFEESDRQRRTGNTSNEQAELRLRKIFMEEIGVKLEGKVQEAGGDDDFRHAIEQLQALMAPFVHFYNGDILNSLPGIKEFIVVLQATSLQMSLSTQMKQQNFLETALSIHPSLVLKWKGKLPSILDLDELQAIRGDALQGPKVKFILDLAECCHLLKEKLLIFSQYLETMELVAEMLPQKFKVATIKGKDRLEERQRTIEEFNESGGISILLASLTACGEGINLTGASRVVFLDMHWNPARMKQAVARAFRIGQKRVVYTYWLIASVEKEAEKFTRIHRKDWLSRSIFSSGTKFVDCHHKEKHTNVEVEDYVLAQLLRNDITKSILKVLNYSASEREKPSAFFEHYRFS